MSSSLERLKQSHPVTVQWRAFELRPPGSPPISPAYRQQIEQKRPVMETMAEQHFGLKINSGPFGIDSRPALIGAKYAEAKQLGEAYNNRVLEAYWHQAQDISDLKLLQEIAVEVGLNAEAYLAALNDRAYIAQVEADVRMAYSIGITGVPAMVFARKYLVSGAQNYDTLVDIYAQVLEAERNGPPTSV